MRVLGNPRSVSYGQEGSSASMGREDAKASEGGHRPCWCRDDSVNGFCKCVAARDEVLDVVSFFKLAKWALCRQRWSVHPRGSAPSVEEGSQGVESAAFVERLGRLPLDLAI